MHLEPPRLTLPGMDRRPYKPLGDDLRRSKRRLGAYVRIPKDLPIAQIEIEVIAALLDDWNMGLPNIAEAAE